MASGARKEGDPLKMYTVVMTLLVLVMAVLYFVIDGKRKEFERANLQAEVWMKGTGASGGPGVGPPSSFPDLANDVERMATTYADATGGTGHDRSISAAAMEQVATSSNLRQVYGSRMRSDVNRRGFYETVSMRFEYESIAGGPPEIWNLLKLLYKIEDRRLYRVTELNWQVADAKDDPDEPFDLIKKPQIEVSIRFPIKKR